MIEIHFYNFGGDKNLINKTLENKTISSGLFLQPFDITTPKLKVRFDNTFDFNYCFIPELNKYYFIENITIISNNIYEIDLNIDVLTTYKNELLNSFGTITKRENANNYISTRTSVFNVLPNIEKIEFTSGLFNENGNIIMICAKGKTE